MMDGYYWTRPWKAPGPLDRCLEVQCRFVESFSLRSCEGLKSRAGCGLNPGTVQSNEKGIIHLTWYWTWWGFRIYGLFGARRVHGNQERSHRPPDVAESPSLVVDGSPPCRGTKKATTRRTHPQRSLACKSPTGSGLWRSRLQDCRAQGWRSRAQRLLSMDPKTPQTEVSEVSLGGSQAAPLSSWLFSLPVKGLYICVCTNVRSIYLSTYLPICLSVHRSIYLSIYLWMYCTYLSIYLSIYQSIKQPMYVDMCACVHCSIWRRFRSRVWAFRGQGCKA